MVIASHFEIMPISEAVFNFVGMVTFTILVLFWILVYTVIVLYRVLNQRMLDMINKPIGTLKEIELKAWKHQHVLVAHSEHLINRYFGSVVLVSICHEFVILITASYQLILAVQASKQPCTTIFSLILIREFFFLSVFVLMSYALALEVLWQHCTAALSDLIFRFFLG